MKDHNDAEEDRGLKDEQEKKDDQEKGEMEDDQEENSYLKAHQTWP